MSLVAERPRSVLDHEIRACVGAMLAEVAPQFRPAERRRDRRYAFPYPIALTPIEFPGSQQPLSDKRFVVVGKHLSERGLDFYHSQAISYRRVLAEFETPKHPTRRLVLELRWCRFGKLGWYENGGRFVGVVA